MTTTPSDRLGLNDRLVVLSGGAGAIGTRVVSTMENFGATVVSVDVMALEARGRTGEREILADVSDPEETARAMDEVLRRFGRLPDVVCCHAGVAVTAPIEEFPLEAYDRIMRVNTRGAFVLAQEAARRWKAAARPGHLIFTSSWIAAVPWPDVAPYSASKAATQSLMRSFARELAPAGIRANSIAPGIVATGMALRQWEEEPEYRSRAGRAIPLGALQTPESVADAFVFLASDLAAYMTGSTLLVDGGCSLYPMDQ